MDRSHPMYLFAIFCLTRLLEQYKRLMYPKVPGDLITFSKDKMIFDEVVNEVYTSLDFSEVEIKQNDKMDNYYAEKAKEAVQELSYLYFLCRVSSIETVIVKTMVFKVDEEYLANKATLGSDETHRLFYEDTLKMLVADIERKAIYTPRIFQENKVSLWEFHNSSSTAAS